MFKSICKGLLICFFSIVLIYMSGYGRIVEYSFYNILPYIDSEGKNNWVELGYIVGHASGGINGVSYTNSVEALLYTIDEGINVIEVDFNYTNDKELVCYHTLSDVYYQLSENISLTDFMSLKVQGCYTPMTLNDVISIMKANPNIYIAVDTKYNDLIEMVQDICNKCKDKDILNRFIIQLYYPNQKEKVQEIYDFPNMLFAPYKYSENPFDTLEVCYRENINVVVVNYKLWTSEIFKLFKSKGIFIYTYTVNRKDIADKLFKDGVYGIYTDFLLDYNSKY